MALILLGSTPCGLCGKLLLEGEEVIGLPAVSNLTHPLYEFFDQGFHLECFEKWDKKDEVLKVIEAERREFQKTNYYKVMVKKYGRGHKN